MPEAPPEPRRRGQSYQAPLAPLDLVKPDTASAGATPRARAPAWLERLRAGRWSGALASRHPADLMVVPIVLLIFAASLIWFVRNHRVFVDDGLYLLQGLNLLEGRGLSIFRDEAEAFRGPVFPLIVGLLTLVLDHDVGAIGFLTRALAVVNPLLVYVLVLRLGGRWAGLGAAVLVAAFGYTATLTQTLNVDAIMLAFLLVSVLLLLRAAEGGGTRAAFASGVALALAILTKETSLAVAPMALLAAGLLGLDGRKMGIHYAGVASLCLPWWLYVLASTGEVFLVGELSTGLALATGAAAVAAAATGLVLWRRGAVRALWKSEPGRRVGAWCVVALWVVVLSGLLLSTSDQAADLTAASARSYLRKRILPQTPIWYFLPLGAVYALVRAARGHREWAFYLGLLVMQVPVSLLLLAERYTLARQFMVTQTLLYGALAALVAFLLASAVERRPWLSRRLPALAAGVLILGLVVPTLGGRGRYLLTFSGPSQADNVDNQLNRAVRDMAAWINANVPDGEGINSTWHYSYQAAFQTDLDHRWRLLELDCPPEPRSLVADACGFSPEIGRSPPRDSVWLRVNGDCAGAALAMSTVLEQMDRSRSNYLLITSDRRHPGLFGSTRELSGSGAFEVVHTSYLGFDTREPNDKGLILLRRTGRPPAPTPVYVTAATAGHAIRCNGLGYAERLPRVFPNGMDISGDKPSARFLRVRIEQIFSDRA